ncbi:MAG: hypothetical protein IT314_17740 [Anaerolineales bacterium]|nr:hypothetical protein [Anaerolineales bacterium]
MRLLKNLLTPPFFPDETKKHQAYLLHIILVALIVVPIPLLVYNLVQESEDTRRTLAFIAIVEALHIALFAALWRGYVRLASVAEIVLLWLFFAAASATGSGIYGIAYMLGNALVIVIAGILLGVWGTMAMTGVSILEGAVMVFAEARGWVPPDILDDALSTWVVIVILFLASGSLMVLSAREIQAGLARARASEERATQRRALLEKVTHLGKRMAEVSDLPTTIEKIWHGVHDDLDFDRLAVFLYDPLNNSMKGTLGTNSQGEIVDEWDVRLSIRNDMDGSTFMQVLETPDGLYYTQDYARAHNIPAGHEMYEVKHFAAVAAWADHKPVAVICVDQAITQRPITTEQMDALKLFAGYAGFAIENARLNEALRNELTHRKSLIGELEKKNAELERFTYTVSHDLKSPLVTIMGFVGYLEKDARAGNQDKIQDHILRIAHAAEKMQALLNELLELSRIGRVTNPPEHIPFAEIVQEAAERVRGRLDMNNVRLAIQDDLPAVYGDRTRLVEVLQNLLDNAAKYSGPQPTPSIEVGAADDAQRGSVFFVRDNGIGIEHQFHERIFGLFNKLDMTVEGTGVGLTLVKRIIEVHGGEIWVESAPGSGSTFYFTLPTIETKE